MSLHPGEILTAAEPKKPIEEMFRAPDGSIDVDAAHAHLQQLQARGAELNVDEVHDAIALVRILRRTNTGPASSKKKTTKKPDIIMNPDDLLDL